MIEVFTLSVLQGVAEFLPISSSGHLVLGKSLMGLGETGIRLDVFLHVGTLAAVFAFYWFVVWRLVRDAFGGGAGARESWSYALKVVLSAVPAGAVGILLGEQVEAAFSSPKVVGAGLVLTGVILTATRFLPRGRGDVSFAKAVLMGLAQALAILPGISRSGMTLAAARASGVEAEKSAEFSFLMSAPPIAGAALLEVLKALKTPAAAAAAAPEVGWGLCVAGAVLSALVGFYSLKFLLRSLKSDKFWLFGPYAFLAGVVTLIAA